VAWFLALVHLTGARDYFVPLGLFSETAPGADAPVDLTAVTYVGLTFAVDPDAPPGVIRISGPIATVPEPASALLALLAALVILFRA
jgi:hypothetical protein